MTPPTQEQVQAAFDVFKTMFDLIKASPNGIPSGELYAIVMGVMSIDQYNHLIQIGIDAGRIRNENHLLTWIDKDNDNDKPQTQNP